MKYFPKRFFLKIFSYDLLIGGIIVLVSTMVTSYFLNRSFTEQFHSQNRVILENWRNYFLDRTMPLESYCQLIKTRQKGELPYRYTLIAENGKVICDTHENPQLMDDHSDRSEIRQALKEGLGKGQRYSHTLQREMYYNALLLNSRTLTGMPANLVLRQGFPLENFHLYQSPAVASIRRTLIVFFFLFILVSFLRGIRFSKSLSRLLKKANHWKRELEDPRPTFFNEKDNEWEVLDRALSRAYVDLKKLQNIVGMEKNKLSILLNSLTEAILAIDKEQQLLFYNPSFAQTFLGESLSKRENLNLWEIFRRKDILSAFTATLEQGRPNQVNEIKMERKDGRFDHYLLRVTPLKSEDRPNQVLGTVGVFYDISKIKWAEQTRVDFVANIGHEVRTPLASIQGSLDLLDMQRDKLSPEALKCLDIINRNTRRIFLLFQDLLNLSLLESERELIPVEVHLPTLTEQIIRNLDSAFAPKTLSFSVSFEKESVYLDKSLLEQILSNLLENAYKYVQDQGEVRLACSSRPNGKGILLKISDNGPGIPKEHQTRVFERFYRAESSRSQHIKGTGLGLSLVKHATLRHQGRVWLESALGQGTTFFVELPEFPPHQAT